MELTKKEKIKAIELDIKSKEEMVKSLKGTKGFLPRDRNNVKVFIKSYEYLIGILEVQICKVKLGEE